MRYLVDKCRKLLSGLHPEKQGNLSAVREPLRRGDFFGVIQFDTLRFHELEKAFAVAGCIALDFCKRRKVFSFGLGDVLSRDLRSSLCALDVCRE